MKLISWNVNGIRACLTKGFEEFFKKTDADIFCIQETKCQPDQIDLEFEGYKSYWNSAEKKGYSGTAIFTKKEPIKVTYGIGIEEHDKEGRVITLEFEKFYMITIYTPNAKRELERLDYRMIWEDEIRKYLLKLNEIKPVIVWLTIPITAITLGVFYPFINVFILHIVDFILGSHFSVNGIFLCVIVAILISIMNMIMDNMIIKPLK